MAAVHDKREGKCPLRLFYQRADTEVLQIVLRLDATSFTSPWIANFTIIPDTFRAEQISFINSVAADLNM